jgi:SAM-dependent methyltransferase
MKDLLKKVGFLVIAAWFGRELRNVWSAKTLEYQHMKTFEGALRDRQKYLEAYFREHEIVKLQIGAGNNRLDGWINSDLEPTSDQIIFINTLEKLPFDDHPVDYVFCEHMIEHINYQGGLFMLRECYRIMKPGGKIRIATPDAEKIAGLFDPQKTSNQKRYLEWSSRVGIGLYSFEKSEMKKRRPEWDIDPVHINTYFPDASQDSVCFVVNNFFRSYGHQFLYDVKTLTAALCEAGFINVAQYSPGKSNDINLQGLEAHYRVIGQEMNFFETMVLEGTRP